MVMVELDTFELNELAKQKSLPESLKEKIEKAVRLNAQKQGGIVFFNGDTK